MGGVVKLFFIDADRLDYTAINEALRRSGPVCRITGCFSGVPVFAPTISRALTAHGIFILIRLPVINARYPPPEPSNGFKGYDPLQRETLRKTLTAAEKRKGTWSVEEMATLGKKIDAKIKLLEERRKALAVASLSFNTFYEYSCERLELICLENNITEIDYDKYAYMIQPFYKGGNYDKILNENVDTTLFSETDPYIPDRTQ